MKSLILLVLFTISSFALTPYSLENIKEINIKFLNKKEIISKSLEEKITKKVKERLEKIGIKTTSEKYANFLIQVRIDNFGQKTFVRTSIFMIEEVVALRNINTETIAITYEKKDSFEAENLETDIYESVVDYLLEDFIEQYKEEN